MSDASPVSLTAEKPKKDRSPSFPFIPLRKAIDRAQEFADNHKRSPTRLASLANTWDYGTKSSGLQQTVAALKQYGLLDDLGSGDDRKLQLSDLAWRILMDTRPGAKDQGVREAALKPKLFAEYVNAWLPKRPGDNHCVSELHLDRGFTQDSARSFLKVFDATVAFAGLKDDDSLSEPAADHGPSADEGIKDTKEGPKLQVGDHVQWESQGALQFPQPRRVTGITNDPVRGAFVFVEGYAGSLPAGQMIVVDHQLPQSATAMLAPERTGDAASQAWPSAGQLLQRATFPLPEGLVALELPAGQLSPDSFEDLKAWLEVMLRRAKRGSLPRDPS